MTEIDPSGQAPQLWRTTGTIALLMAFASISTDLYLPAMPAMARDLHSSAGSMSFTITGFLLGFGAGQLFWGPISDRYGRRPPLLAGLALFILGTAGCAMAGSETAIIGWRMVQAAGASASVVLSRAMVRDLYHGDRAAQVLSGLMAIMAVAPLVGPLAGGQILGFAGWRAIFWTMVGIGVVACLAVARLSETLPPHHRTARGFVEVFRSYGAVLRTRAVTANAAACGFFFAGTFAYIAGSPFVYIVFHHVRAELYGLLFASGIVGIVILNLAGSRLVLRFGSRRMLLFGAAVSAAAGLSVLIATIVLPGSLLALAVPIFAFVSVTGVIVANALALALFAERSQAGTIAAVVGAVQYGSGVVGSTLVGSATDGTPLPMAVVIAFGGCGCLASAIVATRSSVTA